MSAGRVVVYGGKGALGAACVSHFKANNYWVGSIDFSENEKADLSVVLPRESTWVEQESEVVAKVGQALSGDKLDAVICVAGGWIGGNAKKDLAKRADLMLRQSVWTSINSATLASNYLKNGGMLALTGAQPALKGTPSMIAYGMAKAAVHHLTHSLGADQSGLPPGSLVVSILPCVLDTPKNREMMPEGKFSTWTPLSEVAELLLKWTKCEDRPKSGSLLQLITEDFRTNVVSAE